MSMPPNKKVLNVLVVIVTLLTMAMFGAIYLVYEQLRLEGGVKITNIRFDRERNNLVFNFTNNTNELMRRAEFTIVMDAPYPKCVLPDGRVIEARAGGAIDTTDYDLLYRRCTPMGTGAATAQHTISPGETQLVIAVVADNVTKPSTAMLSPERDSITFPKDDGAEKVQSQERWLEGRALFCVEFPGRVIGDRYVLLRSFSLTAPSHLANGSSKFKPIIDVLPIMDEKPFLYPPIRRFFSPYSCLDAIEDFTIFKKKWIELPDHIWGGWRYKDIYKSKAEPGPDMSKPNGYPRKPWYGSSYLLVALGILFMYVSAEVIHKKTPIKSWLHITLAAYIWGAFLVIILRINSIIPYFTSNIAMYSWLICMLVLVKRGSGPIRAMGFLLSPFFLLLQPHRWREVRLSPQSQANSTPDIVDILGGSYYIILVSLVSWLAAANLSKGNVSNAIGGALTVIEYGIPAALMAYAYFRTITPKKFKSSGINQYVKILFVIGILVIPIAAYLLISVVHAPYLGKPVIGKSVKFKTKGVKQVWGYGNMVVFWYPDEELFFKLDGIGTKSKEGYYFKGYENSKDQKYEDIFKGYLRIIDRCKGKIIGAMPGRNYILVQGDCWTNKESLITNELLEDKSEYFIKAEAHIDGAANLSILAIKP